MAVAIIGTLTAIFAASIGIVQTDIKKVLAYSTISQLGYMFMACGVADYVGGIFHLMTHAFFKALLFLAAGSVIHGLGGEQDMRHMGGLRKYLPYTFWCMTIATFAIAGLPPFAGFFSKDRILWSAWSSGDHVLWLIGVITAGMTSFYMFRLWFLTFFGEYRGPNPETPVTVTMPMRSTPDMRARFTMRRMRTHWQPRPRRSAREPVGDGGAADDSCAALAGRRMDWRSAFAARFRSLRHLPLAGVPVGRGGSRLRRLTAHG